MGRRMLLLIIVLWVLITLYNYFYMNSLLLSFIWIGMSLALFVVVLIQLIKLIKERRNISALRVQKVFAFGILLLLTYNYWFTSSVIEKADWNLSFKKRMEVVDKVKTGKLNPNVGWNNWLCELPFEFPVVSNGGNDIGIFANKQTGAITVKFWIFRNFFDSPSTYFVYTNDLNEIKKIEAKIKQHPNLNWKLKENWYRIYGN
jgi:hypothetical protein